MKKSRRLAWHHHPHPGPHPERTLTLREIFEETGDGTLLLVSQGRLAPRPTPRTRVQLADELADLLVHAEVFKRTWWELKPELRDVLWRLLEPLYREAGYAEVADLSYVPTAQELADLEHAGLLFAIPSTVNPKVLAFPYEYFFMPDMPGTGPRSLCQGLRHYSDSGVRILCGELGLREQLPRAAGLARLHKRLIEAGPRVSADLPPAANQLLEGVALRGGVISARTLSDRMTAANVAWAMRLPLAADDLLGARGPALSPARFLARRALLVPCGEPGWSAFPQVAVPEELMETACAGIAKKAAQARAAERRKLGVVLKGVESDARPGQFTADLRRLALVAHIEREGPGKPGRPGKAAKKKLETLLHLPAPELEELLAFAARREGAGDEAWAEALESFLALSPADQSRALAEDFLGPAGWHRDFRRHLITILESATSSWIPIDGLGKHLAHDPVAIVAWESFHAGEATSGEEAWIRQLATADLRTLHRIGFAERASGSAREAYRLAPESAWALTGKKPPVKSAHAPKSAPPAEAGFAVLPTLEVLASPAAGTALLAAIARVARLERADAAFVFRIDRRTIAAGVNSGMKATEIREFLERHSRNPLPHTLDVLLGDLGAGASDVTWDPEGHLLRAKDPMILLKLRRVKWLRPWLVEGAPEGALRLTPEADGKGLVARLKKEGFVFAGPG